MNILIIEDNHSKLTKIKEFLISNYQQAIIQEATSYTSGLRMVYNQDWDVVVLDMSLPVYDMNQQDSGGDKKPIAGKEIMKRMLHRGILIPTLIVTQFDTFGENGITIDRLNEEFKLELKDIWYGTINYENLHWKKELRTHIDNIIGAL